MREFPRAPASTRFRERAEALCSPVRNEPAALERMGRLMDIFFDFHRKPAITDFGILTLANAG
jgi:hypothetical protein